jgi:hypothetical protein
MYLLSVELIVPQRDLFNGPARSVQAIEIAQRAAEVN